MVLACAAYLYLDMTSPPVVEGQEKATGEKLMKNEREQTVKRCLDYVKNMERG